MSVFVFQIEKAFDLFSLPKDDENVIETREFVQFGNEGFTKSFVSAAVRDLHENFVTLFEKEVRNQSIISWWIFQKLFTVWEMKRLGYPALKKVVSIVLTSLSKSEEMRFAL